LVLQDEDVASVSPFWGWGIARREGERCEEQDREKGSAVQAAGH
jgi:hypothetical protein